MRKEERERTAAVVLCGNAGGVFACPLVLGTLNEDGSSNMTRSRRTEIIGRFFYFLSVQR